MTDLVDQYAAWQRRRQEEKQRQTEELRAFMEDIITARKETERMAGTTGDIDGPDDHISEA